MNTHELAHAAGFFDGEGCTYMSRDSSGFRVPHLTISQKDPRELARFHAAVFGLGSIQKRRGRQMSDYHANALQHAQAVIALLWPWLGEVKREQAVRVFTECRKDYRARPGHWKYRTHCKRGHPFSKENTDLHTDRYGVERRLCLACRRFHTDKNNRTGRRRLTVSALLEAV